MTHSKRLIYFVVVLAGVLALVAPHSAYAITGCSNAYLTGTYNARVVSASFSNLLGSMNNSGSTGTGSTGSGGSGGGTTGGTGSGSTSGPGFFGGPSGFGTGVGTGSDAAEGGMTGGSSSSPASANPGGFGNNRGSLSGQTPGIGRYYFDGNGNIIGLVDSNSAMNAIIGSYSISTDCSGTITLRTGEQFNAVVASNGAEVMFIESDAAGLGANGSLTRSATACLNATDFPQTFAFSFLGARGMASSASSSDSGGGTTGAASSPAQLAMFAAVGSLTLHSGGGFALKEWTIGNGSSIQTVNATGNYAIGSDCSLRLTFNNSGSSSSGGGTTGAFVAPQSFRGLLVNNDSGILSVQTDANSLVTGSFVSQ